MRLFISAGEPSGDLHGANLIHALRQRVSDLARRARAHGIPVLYFVPPQLWGWSS
jgi:lipid A disaccharide synthetase